MNARTLQKTRTQAKTESGLMGSRALLALDQVERKLDRSQASEQKYKRLLLNWAPLSAWVGAVASDDDAIEDAAGDDDAMRKAKTLARLRKAF